MFGPLVYMQWQEGLGVSGIEQVFYGLAFG